MPALPNVPNVIGVTVNWSNAVTLHRPVNKLHYSYTGGPPVTGDLVSFANAIFNAFSAGYLPSVDSNDSLVSVAALDLATPTGAFGLSNVASAGGGAGGSVTPAGNSALINWQIARHYRGGKPKTFLIAPSPSFHLSDNSFTAAFLTTVTSLIHTLAVTTGPIIGTSFGSFTCQAMVNVSYYHGFTNFIDNSGRNDSKPTLRPTPLVDVITNGVANPRIHVQRRRLLPS